MCLIVMKIRYYKEKVIYEDIFSVPIIQNTFFVSVCVCLCGVCVCVRTCESVCVSVSRQCQSNTKQAVSVLDLLDRRFMNAATFWSQSLRKRHQNQTCTTLNVPPPKITLL